MSQESIDNIVKSKKSDIEDIKSANTQKAVSDGIVSAAAKANELANNTISALVEPIYDVIRKFKPIPPKLRSVVDVQGAANGLYQNVGEFQKSYKQFLKTVIIEQEVPIEVNDYYENPSKYPDLEEIEFENNEVTEEDCENSGYTKIVQTIDPQWMQKLIKTFPKPEERDVVARQMEKIINTSIKITWQTLQPAVKTIGSIVPIDPINTAMDAVITSIDGVVKVASTTVSEKELNEMIAKKQASEAKKKSEAEKMTQKQSSNGSSVKDLAEKAKKEATNQIEQIGSGVKEGITNAFKNLQTPKFPEEIKSIIMEMKDAIIFVKDNISNIYIVLILKLINQIVDCFKKILNVLGVPKIPDPLGKIPQIASDAYNVLQFVMGLPMSLISCIESIFARKWKMIQCCQIPALPDPIASITSLPSTAEDVKYPISDTKDIINKVKEQ